MLSPMWIILFIIAFLESGIAITLNIFIVITDVKSIKHGLRLNSSHLIRVMMGLVNIVIQCSLTVQGSLSVICVPVLLIKEVYLPLTIITFTMIYCSFWSTAWLCAYYCTSITNFRYGLCVWMKRISSTFQMFLLLLSAVGSFLISLMSIWAISIEAEVQSFENNTLGASFISGTFYFNQLYLLIATFLGCFLPFILMLSCIMLTFSSLLKHVYKIKKNNSGFTRPKLQAHINAIRTLIMLLILYVIFFISEIVLLRSKLSSPPHNILVISWFIVMSYPTAEAIIIIQANSELRKIIVEKIYLCSGRNMKIVN